ncbi:MFS transporter [Paenibacillus beijingensis]|uniref:MFS transporter n=1 Tax=Paenibacillus beijingensis TaxID=1126833 RepID=UPI000698A286|nr:MFS transporter [Paenibacillus beijingensis]
MIDLKKGPLTYTATVLTVTGIAVVSLLYVLIPLVPYISSAFAVNASQTAWASSAFSLAFAVGNVFFGTLSDRVSKKRLIIAGLVLLTLCTVFVESATSFAAFISLRAVQGFLAASFPPVALAYVSDVIPPSHRPTVISYMSSGFLLAGVVGQIFAAEVAAAWGWETVFALLSAVYVVLIVISFWLPKGRERSAPVQSETRAAVSDHFRVLVKIPALLVAYAAAMSILMSFVAMYTGLNEFAVQRLHLSADRILLIRLAGMLGIMCTLFCGSWIRRFGAPRVLVAGFFVAAAGLAGEAVLSNAPMPVFVAATVVFVAGIATAVPSIVFRIGMLGASARGMAIALYGFFVFVGASLGPIIANMLMPLGFAALCWTLSAILLAAAAGTAWSAKRASRNEGTAAVHT